MRQKRDSNKSISYCPRKSGYTTRPGGYFVFERVFENASRFVKPENIKAILYRHQDPDVTVGLTLWLDTAPNAKIYVSHLWEKFIPHLGVDFRNRIIDLPDEGMDIDFGSFKIKAIPAHFIHSPGNFHYYDPIAKIYFLGDMGAAVFKDKWYLMVDNFEEHVNPIEWFRRRYIASRRTIQLWARRIEGLDINIVAPQHGPIFMGENAKKFLNWLKNLEKVGIDFISS